MAHTRISDYRARARLLRDEAKRTTHTMLREDMERMAGQYELLADEIERGFWKGVRSARPRRLRVVGDAGDASDEKPGAAPGGPSWT